MINVAAYIYRSPSLLYLIMKVNNNFVYLDVFLSIKSHRGVHFHVVPSPQYDGPRERDREREKAEYLFERFKLLVWLRSASFLIQTLVHFQYNVDVKEWHYFRLHLHQKYNTSYRKDALDVTASHVFQDSSHESINNSNSHLLHLLLSTIDGCCNVINR